MENRPFATFKDAVLFDESDLVAALLVLGAAPESDPVSGHNWETFVEYSIYEGTVRAWAKSRFGENALADHFHSHFMNWQARQRANEKRAAAIRRLKK